MYLISTPDDKEVQEPLTDFFASARPASKSNIARCRDAIPLSYARRIIELQAELGSWSRAKLHINRCCTGFSTFGYLSDEILTVSEVALRDEKRTRFDAF
jgi:hypothetical protein